MSGIRFAAPQYRELADVLLQANGAESCAVAYAHYNPAADAWVVAEANPVPDSAYERRDAAAATLGAHFMMEVANRSRATGMAAVMIHTHPGSRGYPTFSKVDDRGEAQFGLYLAQRGAQLAHLAMVIGPGGCRARRLDDGTEVPVWEAGERLVLHSQPPFAATEERDDRQVRAFGDSGQRLLRRLHFGVIGAGGTGSLVCQQLAHLGAARVTVIDPDIVEATNLNRLVGSTPPDVGEAKVDIAARMMRAVNPAVEVHTLRADVVDEQVATRLASLDFILLCTDSHASRAVVNQAAYQHLVPVIDMGVSITVRDSVVTHITGRVQMLSPGLPCLTCTRALDGELIRRELMTPEQRAADRYVQGEREPQPAVISINSTVASLAVTMLLGAVTPVPASPRYQRYDGIRGQVREMAATKSCNCVACSTSGALARGASWPLPVRSRPWGNAA
ncbi:ThiF family adenylyltransferase [Roseomonas marmotae]|uniref:HesA/MoeB/ThiF family protein n=1 Tax=Roseomonas marmotae TaxID=2768161 RepID=UPI001AD6F2A8|nr:ThiF family adenylyltransferase [Roseomonas marmotae]QTI78331.1 ThiF family adenylyltransferase [Roseomonas marmotae]